MTAETFSTFPPPPTPCLGNPAGAEGGPRPGLCPEACRWHREVTPALTWGRGLGMPDYAHTQTILLWGSLPAASSHAGPMGAARRRGARLIVADPSPAGQADLRLPVKPGADAALALGLIHLLLFEGGADLAFLRRRSDAFEHAPDGKGTVLERLSNRAALWPPRRVAAVTGVREEALRQAADWLGHRKPVSLYTGTGPCRQADPTAAARAIHILYALTGSLGQPGGNCWHPGTEGPAPRITLWSEALAREGRDPLPRFEPSQASP